MDCMRRLAFFGELRRYIVSSMLLKSASDNITTCSPFTRVTTVGAWSLHTSSITVFKLARASLKVRMFNNIEMQLIRNLNKPVHRIVEDFLFTRKYSGHKKR